MIDIFQAGMDAFDASVQRERSRKAYKAAEEQYGPIAGDPGLFSALKGLDAQDQSYEIRGNQESRAQGTYDYNMGQAQQQDQQKATLGLVQGLRQARDRGEDVGAAFDRLANTLPSLGVNPDDIPAMRQALVDNPAVLDDYYAALTSGTPQSNARPSDRERARLIMNDPNASDPDKTWAASVMGTAAAGPGGADAGATRVSNIIGELKTLYGQLDEEGGIQNPEGGADGEGYTGLQNARRWLSSSSVGRLAGRVTGSRNESARRSIEGLRNHLINAMKSAEGMGARMFDSNKDMELWLSTVTDPSQDYDTVMRLLNNFEQAYGSGGKVSMSGVSEAPVGQPSTTDIYPGWVNPSTGAVYKGGPLRDPNSWEMPQ